MTTNAHALPRTRRRKIKPPHPYWWVAVAIITANLASLGKWIIQIGTGDKHLNGAVAIGVASCIYAAQVWWPTLRSPQKLVVPPMGVMMLALTLSGAALVSDLLFR